MSNDWRDLLFEPKRAQKMTKRQTQNNNLLCWLEFIRLTWIYTALSVRCIFIYMKTSYQACVCPIFPDAAYCRHFVINAGSLGVTGRSEYQLGCYDGQYVPQLSSRLMLFIGTICPKPCASSVNPLKESQRNTLKYNTFPFSIYDCAIQCVQAPQTVHVTCPYGADGISCPILCR